MRELEDELQNPTGISTVSTPKLSVSGVLLSKECGILYEITNSEGLRCAFCPQMPLLMLKIATGRALSSARLQHVRAIFECSESPSLSPSRRCWVDGNLLSHSLDPLLSTK